MRLKITMSFKNYQNVVSTSFRKVIILVIFSGNVRNCRGGLNWKNVGVDLNSSG